MAAAALGNGAALTASEHIVTTAAGAGQVDYAQAGQVAGKMLADIRLPTPPPRQMMQLKLLQAIWL